ncbi:hypothetical protein B0H11DRAFT_2185486 [Mycena galericulata]|nr:hypothetical protein B0H11DRAFT_2185486 [Mycena galericulata]
MPSSELSDALNPAHARPRIVTQPHVPHRSELESAVSEPPPSQPKSLLRPNPSPGALNAVQELVALVAATKHAAEIERTRRLAWEAELEAKYIQRQAETERQILDLRAEVAHLRALVPANGHSPLFMSPALANLSHSPLFASPTIANLGQSPISPVSQPSSQQLPQFVQGSSRGLPSNAPERTLTPPTSRDDSEAPSSAAPRTRRKRRRADRSSDDESGSASDDSSASSRPAPRRTDHHDKRLLTVQGAMRAHILLMMELETGRSLPDSHPEGVPLEPPHPVRFVWDKTTKQSAHNGRMKLRVVDDFRARRRLYKHVADREFSKKVVDVTFEQAFTTFRQNFRTQRDALAAARSREREDMKARKARHISRRKTKLSNRADARLKLNEFEHVIFDGAMQIECMSSEESDVDADANLSPAPRSAGPLRTRGYAWRSRRLLRFYMVLDAEESADASSRPKRGVGRRERFTGPHKAGFHLPPKGIASWMISRRWMLSAQVEQPDLGDTLRALVFDAPGFDWARLGELGDETEDEESMGHMIQPPPRPVHNYTTSSLQCALA